MNLVLEVQIVLEIIELRELICEYLNLISIINIHLVSNVHLPIKYLKLVRTKFIEYRDGYFNHREKNRPKLLKKWLELIEEGEF